MNANQRYVNLVDKKYNIRLKNGVEWKYKVVESENIEVQEPQIVLKQNTCTDNFQSLIIQLIYDLW